MTRQMTLRAEAQGPGAIRALSPATPGSSVDIDVGPNDKDITVNDSSSGTSTQIRVGPGKQTQIVIPNVPGGTVLIISVGQGANRRRMLIEVIEPGP
jgi:hypothetical protein